MAASGSDDRETVERETVERETDDAATIRFSEAVGQVRTRLLGTLPGIDAQARMAPSNRDRLDSAAAEHKPVPKIGAALVLLYPLEGSVHVALTLRSAHLRDHAGQVSFPGGRVEAGENMVEAALREANEELGIDGASMDVLGPLSPLWIPPSNFRVHPIVAAAAMRPSFRPDPREVAHLIEAPLRTLTAPAARQVASDMAGGRLRNVPYFLAGGHKVWGATAMILSELLVIWTASSTAPNPRGERLGHDQDGQE